jgi:hypothetical protein
MLTVALTKAQKPNYERIFGKVSNYELAMTEYEKDKEAEAVVLYETGRYFFRFNDSRGRFDLIMEIKTKIKVLKQAGIKYGEFEIPLYYGDEVETIYGLEGAVYNLDHGKIQKTEFNKKNIYEERPHTNWKVLKFAMPDVREGSVIELQYSLITPYYFNMREWNFQKKIPVVYSSLEYKAIPYYEYVYILKGASKLDEFENEISNHDIQFGRYKYKEIIYLMGMNDLPAFKDEEFITSEKDYMISLNFQISKYHYPSGGNREEMSTWPLICDALIKETSFGKYIKSSEKSAHKMLPELDLKNMTEKEKIEKITQYVKFNYNWNGRESKYSSLKTADFLKQKTGNSADINLFLTGMLRAAGFDANPVVLSTRRNGMINTEYPFIQFLNYVIVQVSGRDTTYLLDATESMLRFDELPQRCINVNGLVVTPKSDTWFYIVQNEPAFTVKSFDVRLNETLDALEVHTEVTSYAHDAYHYRRIFRNKPDHLLEMLKNRGVESAREIDTKNYLNLDQPFVFSYQSSPPVEKADNKIFVSPFLNQSVTENIFKQARRELHVDLILYHAAEYKSVIEIPQGYKVEYLPESKSYNNKAMKIDYQAEKKENKIHITASYEFKSNLYPAKDYPVLKMSYEEIVKKFNEMIVLVKE